MTHLKLLTAVLSLAGTEVLQLLSEMFSTTLVLQGLKKQVLPACSPRSPLHCPGLGATALGIQAGQEHAAVNAAPSAEQPPSPKVRYPSDQLALIWPLLQLP